MATADPSIWQAYLVTFGWAMTGDVSMALGNIILLKVFDLSTPMVDEWQLIKEGNVAMAIIFGSMVLALGFVIGNVIH